MAETGNLGEYKVVIGADFNALTASVEAVMRTVQASAERMTKTFSSMTDSVSKSMGELAASTRTMATQATENFGTLNQSLGNINSAGAEKSMRQFNNELSNLTPNMKKAAESGNAITGIFSKMGSHLEWMAGAALLGGILAIPAGINAVAESTEALNAKIRQNLELSDQYHGNNQKLDADMQRLTNVSNTYAVGFGADINEVQEAMQILSRRFKDVESISYLTSVALTMNRLDFVDLKSAASNLEAVDLIAA